MIKKLLVFLCLTVFFNTSARSDLIQTPYSGKPDKEPTITNEFKANDTRAIIIYSKGGKGQFRWSATNMTTDFPADKAIIDLHKKNITVLLPDWPYSMHLKGGKNYDCDKRCSDDHLYRLLGVMEYAQKSYPNKPIWIAGHSNGSISVEHFVKLLKKLNRLPELSGAIISGSRPETKINVPDIKLAMIHHKNDSCAYTSDAKLLYNKHKEWLKDNVTITWIEGGNNSGRYAKMGGASGGPAKGCVGGTHSYEFAEEEATAKFRSVILGK